MSISDILNIATSGLTAAQAQVAATSDNIANVNTPGYARKIVTQSEQVVDGRGLGVHIDTITRAYNVFMQKASLSASAQNAQAQVISDFLNQVQQTFGDPSSSTSFFSGLDAVYSAFSAASDTPSSTLSRTDALNAVHDFLNNAEAVSGNLSNLRDEANQRAASDVDRVNSLLDQIAQLNMNIARITVSGGDASGSQNTQSRLLDQLSSLMQVQVSSNGVGGVVLRSQDGVYLAGDQGAATLSYATVGGGGMLTATPPKGQPVQVDPGSGEIAGLMQLAGVELPKAMAQLGELVAQAVSQINAAHNDSATVPPPHVLTGEPTGMDLPTAIGNFSGKTTVAIADSSGVMQQRVDINFAYGSGTMDVTDNSGTTTTLSFTSANFLSVLNSALGSEGSATYSGGVLSIGASGAGDGVVIADDPDTPSSSSGMGFSHFFGLNNLIQTTGYGNVTGVLSAASPNTFAAGGTLSLELTDPKGAGLKTIDVTLPASATTMGDVIAALNAATGLYGSFGLDPQGHLAFTPASNYPGSTVSVISDNTVNSVPGPNLTQMLGIGWTTQASRASSYSLRTDIAADPNKLALAQLDLSQAVNGSPALAVGDGRGAVAIANSGSETTTFSAAGTLKGFATSVSAYGANFAGQLGSAATNAQDRTAAAASLLTQVTAQRSAAEGVNLDTELVNLTTYQQSYNACARLVQASKDMYDVLLNIL